MGFQHHQLQCNHYKPLQYQGAPEDNAHVLNMLWQHDIICRMSKSKFTFGKQESVFKAWGNPLFLWLIILILGFCKNCLKHFQHHLLSHH